MLLARRSSSESAPNGSWRTLPFRCFSLLLHVPRRLVCVTVPNETRAEGFLLDSVPSLLCCCSCGVPGHDSLEMMACAVHRYMNSACIQKAHL